MEALQGLERHERGPRSVGADVEQDGPFGVRTSTLAARTVEREPTLRTAPARGWQASPSMDEPRGETVATGAPVVDVFLEQEAQERWTRPRERSPRSGE